MYFERYVGLFTLGLLHTGATASHFRGKSHKTVTLSNIIPIVKVFSVSVIKSILV